MSGEKTGDNAFAEENMFNANPEDTFVAEADEEMEDLSDYDGVNISDDFEEEEEEDFDQQAEEENEEEEEEEADDFNFDGTAKVAEEEEEEDEEEDFDLAEFNKKFNTNIKDQEELKNFLKEKTKDEEVDEDQKLFEDATGHIEFLKPILELNDEDLLTKQFTIKALQEKKDVNDEDVIADINSEVEELRDKGTLSLEARLLRKELQEIVSKRESEVDKITQKREVQKELEQKNYKEELTNTFSKLYGDGKFYGVNVDKKLFGKVYQKVVSGEFEKTLKNKEIVAELAIMNELKEKIFKNATGLTYNDGIGAILKEFKSKEKENPVVKAQKRGSSAKTSKVQGLVADLLFDKSKAKKEDDE